MQGYKLVIKIRMRISVRIMEMIQRGMNKIPADEMQVSAFL
jgi:hypothetical protein